MRRMQIALIGLFAAYAVSAGQRSHDTAAAVQQTATLFEGARLIDGVTGRATDNAAFLVEGSRIARVATKGQTPCRPGRGGSISRARPSSPRW